ncbi:hypothetical protein LX36DRAFT_713066 [Colletotrichum falcatum]|nr:hypothetical protein LX36DRAFT_713066 [Colletotrichum falcatum]
MASEDRAKDIPAPPLAGPPAKVPTEKELARKVRKREFDRRAQRQARERTRNRIAELEAQVKELSKDDSTRLSACMEQLAAVTRERDRFVDTFKSIEQVMSNHALPVRRAPAARPPPRARQPGPTTNPGAAVLMRPPSLHSCSAPLSPMSGTPSVADAYVFHGRGFGNELAGFGPVPNRLSAPPSVHGSTSASDNQDVIEELEEDDGNEGGNDAGVVIAPPPELPCECTATPAGHAQPRFNIWRAVNQILCKGHLAPEEVQVAEDADDEDIPVRVLIEGWDAVAESRPLSKLWKKLRGVDEVLFCTRPPKERLAILRIMHMQFKYLFDPTPEQNAKLPRWYLKRPSQSIPHSCAIDFLVWPGLRERFVFGQHAYCGNKFWELFAPNLHIMWPFEFSDAYRKCSVTGRYQISPLFEQRIMDINAWAMGPDFFARYPELMADMPTSQSIGQSLIPVRTPPPVPQQASLPRLREQEEQLLPEEQEPPQDLIDCTQAMQVFSPGIYSMVSPAFEAEYTPPIFDANDVSYGPLSECF